MTFPFMNNFRSVQFPTIFYVYYFTFPLPRLAFFSFKRGDLKVSDSTCAISGIASVYPWVTVAKSVVNALLTFFSNVYSLRKTKHDCPICLSYFH